ncbi:ring-1,2-phenylacetyl-CoA epoxidase subunit PaaC [Palleronia marisminoris]|uniref:1,2-phenylacetyl-CoA epoxidase, subunit C n=1 Tax=Palleronia marisminoris TaxID=315423 RepID=A0A1Y5R9V9_9RHOB|nr:1,2-phenylacetyl-CoA epoxidase subunit PaaC [Palleronia marisminoris]SFG09937.1 ring-1,2-phenylacetyl-CoA epoxidase subunit PaaC [Palleronia marisminoris]SLN12482.1 1,2-phenylacetyl-CoA epoxidase, subunit C [Palleronia marisminoris]
MPSLPDMNTPNVEELAARAAKGQSHDPHLENVELKPAFFDWLCRMGDSTLILGHRVSEWCGKAPALEEDIALANTALDLIGHTQMWLGLAAEVEDAGRDADRLAYLRDAMKFRNLLIVELPKGDMAQTVMRQFLFDAWHHAMLTRLLSSTSPRVAEIAAKALKEVTYHLERSSDLVIRLGDGTEESNRRMRHALDILWPYTGEMFMTDSVDEAVAAEGIAPRADELRTEWVETVREVLDEATLDLPKAKADAQKGGKSGRHTEHLGFLLAEMQFLQRAYPGAEW